MSEEPSNKEKLLRVIIRSSKKRKVKNVEKPVLKISGETTESFTENLMSKTYRSSKLKTHLKELGDPLNALERPNSLS